MGVSTNHSEDLPALGDIRRGAVVGQFMCTRRACSAGVRPLAVLRTTAGSGAWFLHAASD